MAIPPRWRLPRLARNGHGAARRLPSIAAPAALPGAGRRTRPSERRRVDDEPTEAGPTPDAGRRAHARTAAGTGADRPAQGAAADAAAGDAGGIGRVHRRARGEPAHVLALRR